MTIHHMHAKHDQTVKYQRKLWNIETRVGGVYQLRRVEKDGTVETALVQRRQFVVLNEGAKLEVQPKPTSDIRKPGFAQRTHQRAQALEDEEAGITPGEVAADRQAPPQDWDRVKPADTFGAAF